MAKYNMFLGKAVGKVGDVVFSLYDGKQVARSRNRSPRNPNSNAQRVQRAVMASILRAYSAGKIILDHSFEGQSVGLGNMKRFLKLNLNNLRSAVLADLAAGSTGAACQGRVTGPEVNEFVPFPFIVSEGSLSQDAFDAKLKATPDSVNIGEWLTSNNIRVDDIFTCLVYQCLSPDTQYNTSFIAPGATDYYGKVGRSHFSYLQLRVKTITLPDLTIGVDEVTYNDIFDVVAFDGINFDGTSTIVNGILTGDTLPLEGSYFASGVIRSRESSGQRSTCVLEYPTDIQGWAAEFGLTSDYIIAAWDKEAKSAAVDPMLILEGSNFNLAPGVTPGRALIFNEALYYNASGVQTAWPGEGSTGQVNGKSLGQLIEFVIGIDVDYDVPVTEAMAANIKIQTKLSTQSDWSDWGEPDGLDNLDGEQTEYSIVGHLPSSVPTGAMVNFRVVVNGDQVGGTVIYGNFA